VVITNIIINPITSMTTSIIIIPPLQVVPLLPLGAPEVLDRLVAGASDDPEADSLEWHARVAEINHTRREGATDFYAFVKVRVWGSRDDLVSAKGSESGVCTLEVLNHLPSLPSDDRSVHAPPPPQAAVNPLLPLTSPAFRVMCHSSRGVRAAWARPPASSSSPPWPEGRSSTPACAVESAWSRCPSPRSPRTARPFSPPRCPPARQMPTPPTASGRPSRSDLVRRNGCSGGAASGHGGAYITGAGL
jgi:hypothetical protein